MRIGTSNRLNRKRRVWWRTVLFSERYEYHPSISHHSRVSQHPIARGLHPEKRTVHRKGTTYQQTYWVRGETLDARRQGSSSVTPSSPPPPPSVAPPQAPAPSHGAGAPSASPTELEVEQLPEEVRETLRNAIDRLNPMERQMMLAHLAVRIHENGSAIGHPVMMLSAPGVGKTTLWEAMMNMSDAMAEQGAAPFRVHIVNVQSAVYNITEQMGAQAIDEGMVRFMFTADLEHKIQYCKQHGVPLVLVFDEATKSPQILQTMLSLITNGIVADRRLGVPFRIVLLGNRADWESEMGKMRSSLVPFADRFIYYVTTPSEEDEYVRAIQSVFEQEASRESAGARERLRRFVLDYDEEAEREAEAARQARQAASPELAGAAGELEQMRAKLETGRPAREVMREHQGLMTLLKLMSSRGLRSDLRAECAKTNYRIASALIDAMLSGDLAGMWHNFKSAPNYMPDYASMDSDRKHMSPRRVMILADQLSVLFALGYDLDSPEVERFLACNVGRPNIPKIHEIIQTALKPRGEESVEAIMDDAAESDAYHGRTVHRATRVHDAATHEGVFITHSDRAKEAGAKDTQATFKNQPIETIDDLIRVLSSDDTPPSQQPYGFSLPLHYLDTDTGKLHVGTNPDGTSELHMPGFDSHASADLTRSKHLLHLAGQHGAPAAHALHLEGVDPRSPLGRGVRAILGSGNPEIVAQRLHDTHTETERSLNRLDSLLETLAQSRDASTVNAISREAHRAAAGMGLLSMFHTPVIDAESGQELLPEEIRDEYRAYHEEARRKQHAELGRLAGLAPEHVAQVLAHPAVNVAPLHASARGRIRDTIERHWETVNNVWEHLSPEHREELLHALHLLSAHGHLTDAPYGTIAERR